MKKQKIILLAPEKLKILLDTPKKLTQFKLIIKF